MKAKSIFSLFLVWILAVLGFSTATTSCARCEYGCPYSDFVMKGIVTDVNENPIKGIKVTIQDVDPENGNAWDRMEPVYTDENGAVNYHDSYSMIFGGDENTRILLEDVDGAENGGYFETKAIVANIEKTQKGDGNWNEGNFECSFKVALELAKPE